MKFFKNGFSVIIIIFIFVISVFVLSKYQNTTDIFLANTKIRVTIANTSLSQSRGLSHRVKLNTNEGMLFIFKQPGIYQFWMKDMNFPIDIIWFDKYKKIISVNKNIQPSSYPELFAPISPVLFVLEVPSGFFTRNNLQIGDQLNW